MIRIAAPCEDVDLLIRGYARITDVAAISGSIDYKSRPMLAAVHECCHVPCNVVVIFLGAHCTDESPDEVISPAVCVDRCWCRADSEYCSRPS